MGERPWRQLRAKLGMVQGVVQHPAFLSHNAFGHCLSAAAGFHEERRSVAVLHVADG